MNEALVTYPGLNDIIACSYTRCNGISPGFATIRCTPQNGWPAKVGTLRMQYPGFYMELRDCIADNLSFQFDDQGQLWGVTILDRRWKWRYGSMYARFNIRFPNGPVDKLDTRSEKTPRELIELLLREGLNETGYTIGKLPIEMRPSIYWDISNPAQELANLCDQFGMSIILRNDNTIAIMPRGFASLDGRAKTQLPDHDMISDSGAYDPPELPDRVIFTCGPSLYQVDLPMQAVGDDIDGLIKPINELSYAPKGRDANGELTNVPDWRRADIISFYNIPLYNPGDFTGTQWNSYTSPRELARACIFKKYQVRATRLVNGEEKKIKVEGYKKRSYQGPRSQAKYGPYRTEQGYISDLVEILPIGSELIEPTFEPKTGWYRPVNCVVWGLFARNRIDNNIPLEFFRNIDESNIDKNHPKPPMRYQARNPNNGQLIASTEATVIPPEEYSVDPDTGVFTFSDRIFRVEESTDPLLRRYKQAILWVRLAITITSPTKRSVDREIVEFNINDIRGFQNAVMTGAGEMVVRDDDIFLRVEPRYSPGNPESSAENPKDNLELIKRVATERVEAEMAKYQKLGPRTVTYAGWKKIENTGDLVQVNYSMGQSGATTSVAIDNEMAALVVPYSERRFLEKIRNEALDKVMEEYNRIALQNSFIFSRLSSLGRTGR